MLRYTQLTDSSDLSRLLLHNYQEAFACGDRETIERNMLSAFLEFRNARHAHQTTRRIQTQTLL